MEDKPADVGNVIIITSEDDADDTIKPSLKPFQQIWIKFLF